VLATQFEAHTETSALQQEWFEQEGREFEEEMKSGVQADQLFDNKFGGNASMYKNRGRVWDGNRINGR
jgi:hypothetical protein